MIVQILCALAVLLCVICWLVLDESKWLIPGVVSVFFTAKPMVEHRAVVCNGVECHLSVYYQVFVYMLLALALIAVVYFIRKHSSFYDEY